MKCFFLALVAVLLACLSLSANNSPWGNRLSETGSEPTGTDGSPVELAVLSEKSWDEFVPHGKEVDAIYGDYVLRNQNIVAVIANPIPGRNANMTVKDVGGSIIDLTTREGQSDQLSAYYPGRRAFAYQLARVTVEGSEQAGKSSDATELEVRDGKVANAGQVVRGDRIHVHLVAPAAAGRPEVRLEYTLDRQFAFVEVKTEFHNKSDKPLSVLAVDDFRADRSFQTARPGETDLVWFYDKWWGQAYGLVAGPGTKLRLSGSPVDPRTIEFLNGGKPTLELGPGESKSIVRRIFPAPNLVAIKAAARSIRSLSGSEADSSASANSLRTVGLRVRDAAGRPVDQADVDLSQNGEFYASARTNRDGEVALVIDPADAATYRVKVSSLGRTKELDLPSRDGAENSGSSSTLSVELPNAARAIAHISAEDGGPTPCKVQFIGIDGTDNPNFFDDTGEHAVRNLVYSHDGQFTQNIPPGKYEVLISRGPEFNLEKRTIDAKSGEDVEIKATMRRVIQSPGWVSTDFHSHSSPSGDNTSSQLGRVLNLLAEHIEFAPCTEHNRLDTYVPHLKSLRAEAHLGTCIGIELTSVPGTINHQNAFPMVMKPRVQDNGAPLTDLDPEVQIKRLALWDSSSEKLVQQNHPDIGEMFFDRNGDGMPDGGFKGMFEYQDVIEVHPIHGVLDMNPYRTNTVVDRTKMTSTTTQYNNSIFNWLQLLNQGRRLPGVVNSDAHYNFHGSGFIRNYVKCKTDDPAKIDPLDIVHASEKGRIIMTNGPYLEVTLYEGDKASNGGGALAGDELALPSGQATLHIRVQCPNWFDINRVQVLLNGKKAEKLNWTRAANPDLFSDEVVRFDRRMPLVLREDTHVIVTATGENLKLGPVMGPTYGAHEPTAISNPIFVDVDGGGFKANGDTLGQPLPVKGGKVIDPPKAEAGGSGSSR